MELIDLDPAAYASIHGTPALPGVVTAADSCTGSHWVDGFSGNGVTDDAKTTAVAATPPTPAVSIERNEMSMMKLP